MNNHQHTDVRKNSIVSIKESAHLYDESNEPKVLPGKYALSKAELFFDALTYNHTPASYLTVVEEANLPITQ